MQSERTSTIRCPNSFEAFRNACAGHFYIERLMYGAHLNVYHFPTFPVCHMSDGLRMTEENYAEAFASWQTKPLTTTSIYLWSERPVDDDDMEFYRPSPSEFRREMLNRYDFCCLACKYVYKNTTSALEVCHILQIEETNGLCAEEQMDLIRKCDLVDIDDPHNFLLLCGTCHIHFDNHLLGIQRDRDAFRWVVKPTLEQTPLPHSTETYGTLLASNIRFPYASPMPRVIDHRYKRYIWGTKARKRKVHRIHPIASSVLSCVLRVVIICFAQHFRRQTYWISWNMSFSLNASGKSVVQTRPLWRYGTTAKFPISPCRAGNPEESPIGSKFNPRPMRMNKSPHFGTMKRRAGFGSNRRMSSTLGQSTEDIRLEADPFIR
jgi:hypothetical protein